MKRGIDVLIALLGLGMLLIFGPLIMVAIRAESGGKVLFPQRRWGRNGKIIRIWKFRTMHVDSCDASGVAQATRNDPRVTRVGRVLRRHDLDELPQLWNVLTGDMSVVGPRCHPVGMLAAGVPYEELVPDYHARHRVRPGMTGLSQMRGLRGPTDRASKARARIACDLHYIQNYSLGLDLKIMLRTILTELRSGGGC